MMRQLIFKRLQINCNNRKRLYTKCIIFFCLFLFSSYTYTQTLVKAQLDTITLMQNEYAILNTNNGSQCICSINNISKAQIATVVTIGDTQNVRFNDSTLFNGIHMLAVQKQIIAVADFKGSQLTVSNMSPYKTIVIISFLCTKDD